MAEMLHRSLNRDGGINMRVIFCMTGLRDWILETVMTACLVEGFMLNVQSSHRGADRCTAITASTCIVRSMILYQVFHTFQN